MPLPLSTGRGKEPLLFIKVLPPHSMALFNEATGLAFFAGAEVVLKVSVGLPTFMLSSCPPSFQREQRGVTPSRRTDLPDICWILPSSSSHTPAALCHSENGAKSK